MLEEEADAGRQLIQPTAPKTMLVHPLSPANILVDTATGALSPTFVPYISSPTNTLTISPTTLRRHSRSGSSTGSNLSGGLDSNNTSPLQEAQREQRAVSVDDRITESVEEEKIDERHSPSPSQSYRKELSAQGNSSSPSGSPEVDHDADPSCYLDQHTSQLGYKTLKDYPVLKSYLEKLSIDTEVNKLKRWEKMALKKKHKLIFENFIPRLPIADLQFLSRYMHSVQNLKSYNRYFQVLRAECGFHRLFSEQGNTKTWQNLRHQVKSQILSTIRKDVRITGLLWDFYYTLFNEHSGRIAFLDTDSAFSFKHNLIRRKSNSSLRLRM